VNVILFLQRKDISLYNHFEKDMETTPDKETKDKISFITFIIVKFASAYKMDKQDAYFYLKKYGGLDYIFNYWWALHTDNPFWAVRDIYKVCRNNGGMK
jgi:hypothetical protein